MPLSAIGLRSVGWNTVRAPNIGHFRVILGAKKGLSGLLMGSPGLNGTVGLILQRHFALAGSAASVLGTLQRGLIILATY